MRCQVRCKMFGTKRILHIRVAAVSVIMAWSVGRSSGLDGVRVFSLEITRGDLSCSTEESQNYMIR